MGRLSPACNRLMHQLVREAQKGPKHSFGHPNVGKSHFCAPRTLVGPILPLAAWALHGLRIAKPVPVLV